MTKSAYLALEQLFNPSGKSNSGALKFNATVFLHLYELDLDLLPFLGVRYLITDLQLHDPLATLRAQQSSDDAPPIFLYELANPNLGNWSPTKTVLARSFSEAMALLRSREFDLLHDCRRVRSRRWSPGARAKRELSIRARRLPCHCRCGRTGGTRTARAIFDLLADVGRCYAGRCTSSRQRFPDAADVRPTCRRQVRIRLRFVRRRRLPLARRRRAQIAWRELKGGRGAKLPSYMYEFGIVSSSGLPDASLVRTPDRDAVRRPSK